MITDVNGTEITDPRLADVFRHRKDFGPLTTAIRKVKTLMYELSLTDHGTLLNGKCLVGVGTILRSTRDLRPHAVCPVCEGKGEMTTSHGVSRECPDCQGRGWLTKKQYASTSSSITVESSE